ncbi:MAG TPA: hypothetical protein P5543_01805 [Planctomycetota bacterium]|nr:hypothetical protein [Planctomycetota bacterium]
MRWGGNLALGRKFALGRNFLGGGKICSGKGNLALGRAVLLWGEKFINASMKTRRIT